MLGNTECIVSVGSDLKLQWTQTCDGSLNLSIRLITGYKSLRKHRKEKEKLFHHTESWENKDRIVQFELASADPHGDPKQTERPVRNRQLRQGDGREHGRRTSGKSRDNLAANNQSEDDQSCESQDQNDSSQDQIAESEVIGDDMYTTSRKNEANTVSACVYCRNIREKVEREFSKRRIRLRECHSSWINNPEEFFGATQFISSEQWSFRALTDSENQLDKERNPFHKLNLAYHLQKRIEESKLPELSCRKAMLQEIYPGFKNMQRKDRDPLYQRFERYLKQGEALLMITTENTGILLTVTQLLSRADLAHLSKEWESCACRFPWLTTGILQESKQYEEVTTIIRTYMQRTPKRRTTAPHQASREKRLQLQSLTNTNMEYPQSNLPEQNRNSQMDCLTRHESAPVATETSLPNIWQNDLDTHHAVIVQTGNAGGISATQSEQQSYQSADPDEAGSHALYQPQGPPVIEASERPYVSWGEDVWMNSLSANYGMSNGIFNDDGIIASHPNNFVTEVALSEVLNPLSVHYSINPPECAMMNPLSVNYLADISESETANPPSSTFNTTQGAFAT